MAPPYGAEPLVALQDAGCRYVPQPRASAGGLSKETIKPCGLGLISEPLVWRALAGCIHLADVSPKSKARTSVGAASIARQQALEQRHNKVSEGGVRPSFTCDAPI